MASSSTPTFEAYTQTTGKRMFRVTAMDHNGQGMVVPMNTPAAMTAFHAWVLGSSQEAVYAAFKKRYPGCGFLIEPCAHPFEEVQ